MRFISAAVWGSVAVLGTMFFVSEAHAQQSPPPLPPPAQQPAQGQYPSPPPGQPPPQGQYPQYAPPPNQGQYPQGQPQYAPQYQGQPQYAPQYQGQPQYAPQYQGQPQYAPQYQGQPQYAPQYQAGPPPPYRPREPSEASESEPEVPTHAPKFSLYAGLRLSYIGYGGSWYAINDSTDETTGNLVKQGPALELDVGARLGKRYIPFFFYEHAFLATGHHFDTISASAGSTIYGVGLRSISGDIDSVGVVTEITIGKRTVSVSSGDTTYSMSTIEFLKFGLGAEIRVSTLFTLSPLAFIGAGQMSDTEGTVQYQPGDGAPIYKDGAPIRNSGTYVVLGLGVGAHFDFFGK